MKSRGEVLDPQDFLLTRPPCLTNPLFFYTLFLPDGNKKNKKKSHEYLEATTSVACRGWTLELDGCNIKDFKFDFFGGGGIGERFCFNYN